VTTADRKKLRDGLNAIIPILDATLSAGPEEMGHQEDAAGDKIVEQGWEGLEFLRQARDALQHGGHVLVLTKAEFRELSQAFGNSVSEPDWYRSWATNKKALLSVAQKVQATVLLGRRR
jgi:hypothetical protein